MDLIVLFTILAFYLGATSAYDEDDDFAEDIPNLDSDESIESVVPLESTPRSRNKSPSVSSNPLQLALSRIYEIKLNQSNIIPIKFVKKHFTTTETVSHGQSHMTTPADHDRNTNQMANYGPTPSVKITNRHQEVSPFSTKGRRGHGSPKSIKGKFNNVEFGYSNQSSYNTMGDILKIQIHGRNKSSLLRFKWPNNKKEQRYKFYLNNVLMNMISNSTWAAKLSNEMDRRYKNMSSTMPSTSVRFIRKNSCKVLENNSCVKNESTNATTESATVKQVHDMIGVKNRLNILGLDLEIWRSEKIPLKQEMAKKMLLKNQGQEFSHYLSNVPKLNRHFKPVHPKDDTSIADALAAKVRVVCWVITHPGNHRKLPVAIKNTWGRKCTKLVFFSTEYDASIPTVKLPVREGRQYLWGKMKAALKYVYDKYRYEADWFLRTDDDTYVIMENLRYLLASYEHRKPLYLGCRFRPYTPQGYMSGGAGMVLSREALDRVVRRGLRATNLCDDGDEGDDDDARIGICLHRVGVKAMDTRDSEQRGRFWPFSPQDHVVPYTDPDFWYWRYTYYPNQYGIDCCSDYSVSFHYQSSADMYTMEFLIYKLRPYGIQYKIGNLPNILKNSMDKTKVNDGKSPKNLNYSNRPVNG